MFRIKNLANYKITVLGQNLQNGDTIDLQAFFSNAVIRQSLLSGELFYKMQGRMIAVLSPAQDMNQIGLSTIELARLANAGIWQGFLGTEELKPPFSFSPDGYLYVSSSAASSSNTPQAPILFNFTGSRADSDATLAYYFPMDNFSFFSLQYVPAGDGYQSLTVHASNEDVADETLATYTDVTNDFFGSAAFTTENWLERDTNCSINWVKIEIAVTGLGVGDTAIWDLFCKRRGS